MGALHHQFLALTEIAGHRGRVIRGTVVAVRGDGGEVEVEVAITARWPAPAPPPPPRWWRWWRRPPPPPPARETFRLTPPVAWTDPHVSPVQIGYPGALRVVEVGQDVLIVQDVVVEALPATPRNLDGVALAFDAATRAAYPSRPVAELTGDLADPGRRDLALTALRTTGRLDGGALLDGHDPGRLRGLLETVLTALDAAELARLLAQATTWARGRDAAARGERLATLVDHLLLRALPADDAARAACGHLLGCLDPDAAPERSRLHLVARVVTDRWRDGRPLGDGWAGAVGGVVRVAEPDDHARPALLGVVAALAADDRGALAASLRADATGAGARRLGATRRAWYLAVAEAAAQVAPATGTAVTSR
ncbi:MAG: hypothetical protein H6708_19300 [Kofleriaceae bacterium]|nr:hypothetical protein [Kofleriaceae bacterium]